MDKPKNDKEMIRKYLSDQEDAAPGRKEDRELVEKILSTAKGWSTHAEDEAEEALSLFRAKTNKETKVLSLQTILKVAAVLVVGLTLVFYFFNQSSPVNYVTAKGQKTEIALPDGSSVFLDVESQITYDEKDWPDDRTLELGGKAFFEVTEGSDFTVKSTNGTVSVLGTSFTINDRNGSYSVECYTGKVEVSSGVSKEVITPGEKVKLAEAGLGKSKFDIRLGKEWVTGVINYEMVDLETVFEDLQRQYDVTIQMESSEAHIYTGSVNLQQTALANLERICLIMGLTVSETQGIFIVTEEQTP